ncbi:MAG: Coenzyme F420 hydrogenase/dehydrogenase, beta subunit C-terminal domain [Candidatus Hermodarchaeota archaeon]
MNESTVAKTRQYNLCVSCEICLAVCPEKAISMEYSLGKFQPKIDADKCIECEKCLINCPGIDLIPQEALSKNNLDLIIKGNVLECYTAYSKNAKLRHNSTSGGIITTLVKELIDVKEYSSVFVLDFDNFDNSPARLEETDDTNKIIRSAKSKYLPASVFNVITKLSEKPCDKAIIIGTPCQISGIKKFIVSNKIDSKNLLFLGLFCSSTLSFNYLHFIEDNYSRKNEKIKEYLYRTKEKFGWPGNSKVTFDSGREKILDRTIRTNLKKYFELNRCLFCFDKANCNADLVFADCYIKNKQDVKGTSNILVRTEKGKEIIYKYSDLFIIEKEPVEQIWESQNIQNEKQYFIFSRIFVQEKGLLPGREEQYHISPSYKAKLNQLQKYVKWGEVYRKRKIKYELKKTEYLQSIKRLLLIVIEKAGKVVLPPLILLKGFLVHRNKKLFHGDLKRKNIVIMGGKFFNEGSQAMTLIAANQIKKRKEQYNFFNFTNSYQDLFNEKRKDFKIELIPWTNNEKFSVLGFPFNYISKSSLFSNLTSKTTALLKRSIIIDLSGFALSSDIREYVWIPFLINIILAKQFSVPYYIFPQAIGPFDFRLRERIFLYPLLKWYLKYPDVIYCREKDSYRSVRRFTSENIKLSHDIVLLHKFLDISNIVSKTFELKEVQIEQNSVGIVPNSRVLARTEREYIDSMYHRIIQTLLNSGKKVYILYNSYEDLTYCRSLKKKFLDVNNVKLISEELNSIELEIVTRKFNFLITSRYHSVIQAYKNGIPTIVIGWAAKYLDLLTQFEQIQYCFDIRKKPSLDEVIQKVDELILNYKKESGKIQTNLERILKQDSPFNYLEAFL